MADLTALTAEVEENSDVIASAVTLLAQLADIIRNTPADQGALDELAATLDANSASLAAAVAANTPAPAEEPTE
jgi:hypothetical protein